MTTLLEAFVHGASAAVGWSVAGVLVALLLLWDVLHLRGRAPAVQRWLVRAAAPLGAVLLGVVVARFVVIAT